MANAYTNPLVIDTAAANLIVAGDLFVDVVRWVGAVTAGDQAVIQDGSGNTFWASKAAATPASPDQTTLARICPGGLKVPTLGSGTLYIYHGVQPRN